MKIRSSLFALFSIAGILSGLVIQSQPVFASNTIMCDGWELCEQIDSVNAPSGCVKPDKWECSCNSGQIATCGGTSPGIHECSAEGKGTHSCSTGESCVCTNPVVQTHKECNENGACVVADGAGPQECPQACSGSTGSTTHKACVGTTCSVVSGSGTDSCTNNGSCGATRNGCILGNNYSCGPVPWDGLPDQCNVPADCYGQPSADIKANGSNGPITVPSGSNVTLSWGASVSDVCNASGGWSGEKGRVRADGSLDGSESFGPITSTKTFTITCTGSTGSASDSVTVNVSPTTTPGTGRLQGRFVDDKNGNGVQDAGEPIIQEVTGNACGQGEERLSGFLMRYKNSIGAEADAYPSACNPEAFYFADIAPGTYTITPVLQSGWTVTKLASASGNTTTITSGGTSDIWVFVQGPTGVVGTLDSATCDAISGWARDTDSDPTPGTAHAAVTIQLFNGPAGQGGVFLGQVSSTISREPSVGNHGFSWPIPITLKDGVARQIYAYGLDVQDSSKSRLLDASPKPLTCEHVPSAHADLGVVMIGPSDAQWRVGAPDDANWVPWNSATNWSDSHDSIPGAYTIQATPPKSGFTLKIDGVERQSATVQSVEGTPLTHTWVIEYEEICPASAVELAPVPLTVRENQTITIPWRRVSGCAHAKDWIALVPTGGNDPILSFKYWNNSFVPPNAKPTSQSGSVTFTTPAGVSKFQAIYLDNDGFTEVGRSAEIGVISDACATNPAFCAPMAFLGCKSVSATGTIGLWQTGPCKVPFGVSTEIKWSSTDATSCFASSDPQDLFWHGMKSASGTITSGPITRLTNFDVICNGPGGTSESDRVVVDVEEETIPTINIEADGTGGSISIDSGDDVTITWDSDNASGCNVTPTGWTGLSGSQLLTNQTTSRTYTATCTAMNNTSTVSDSVTVNIIPPHHLGCLMINGAKSCSQVTGAGTDACSTVSDCGSPKFHSECDGNACLMVEGGGRDECANNDQCGRFGWHTACKNNSCAFIEGEGDDTCSDDAECGGNGFCSFGAAPDRLVVPPAKPTTLSWDCGGVKNCKIAQNTGSDVSGPLNALSGSKQSKPSATTRYTLSCEVFGTGEEVTSEITVKVFNFDGGLLKEILPR